MSIQAVPNQPLDWQLLPLPESDCPDCPPADYCSPMLFERYESGGLYYYRSVDYFSYQILGSLSDGDICFYPSVFEIDREDNSKTTFNDDGSVTITFGGRPCDQQSSVNYTEFKTFEGCPLIIKYCLEWDRESVCEQERVYPIVITISIFGNNTDAHDYQIVVQENDTFSKCGTIVFGNIKDGSVTMNINATQAIPCGSDCPGEDPLCECTAQLTFSNYVGCNYEPLNIVTANGTVSEWDGVFQPIYSNISPYNDTHYAISGVWQITGIPEVAQVGASAFETFVRNCLKINLGATLCCDTCSEQVFVSTCIKPITDPCGTVNVTYYQDSNILIDYYGEKPDVLGFGFIYPAHFISGSPFKQYMRFKANVRDAKYDGAMVSYQDSLGRKRVVYAERRKSLSLNTDLLPEFVHDALSLACRHDNFFLEDELFGVNDNFFTRTTDYSPTYVRMSRLSPVKLEVEAKTQDLKKNMCI